MAEEVIPEGRELDVQIARLLGWTWDERSAWSPSESTLARVKDENGWGPDDPWWWLPLYSTSIEAAWDVFVWGLLHTGHATIDADMEDFGRGAILGDGPEQVVTAYIGDRWVTARAPEAICRAALAAVEHERRRQEENRSGMG